MCIANKPTLFIPRRVLLSSSWSHPLWEGVGRSVTEGTYLSRNYTQLVSLYLALVSPHAAQLGIPEEALKSDPPVACSSGGGRRGEERRGDNHWHSPKRNRYYEQSYKIAIQSIKLLFQLNKRYTRMRNLFPSKAPSHAYSMAKVPSPWTRKELPSSTSPPLFLPGHANNYAAGWSTSAIQ